MKIWVIGRNYPDKTNKMCGSFEVEQAKMLHEKGNDVSYIACVFHPLYKAKKWGWCEWDEGIHVYTYSQLYAPQRFKIYWDKFKAKRWRDLLTYVEKKEGLPDVIHVHYPTMITVPDVILSYQEKGVKIVATEHWTKVQSGKLDSHEFSQLKKYVTRANAFICVGNPLKRRIEKLTAVENMVHVIPNMVNDLFGETTKTHKGFRFVIVGRLVAVKQVDKVIEAFATDFRGQKEVTLTVIGGGREFRKLRSLAKRLDVSEQVIFTGTLNRAETAEIVRNSDALVSFSRLETFGVPIIEAWYCGIPAIATDSIGFLDYWKPELGELISYKDMQMLVEAMKKIHQEYPQYSRANIKSFAQKFFSKDSVYQQLSQLYED